MINSLYEIYLEKKQINRDKLYLFKDGKYYLFLDEDAGYISDITTLRLYNHNNEVCECRFPVKYLDKYLTIFNNLKLDVEVIDNTKDNRLELCELLVRKLDKINVNDITPIMAINVLKELKDITWFYV